MTKLERLEVKLSKKYNSPFWIFKKSGRYYIQSVIDGSFDCENWFKTLGQIEDWYNLVEVKI